MREGFLLMCVASTFCAAASAAQFQVNTRTGNSQWFCDIATDPNGSFVVVWTSYTQDGSSGGIYGQRFDANGGAVGDEFRVNTTTQGNQTEPAVAIDEHGNFVVVWHGPQAPGDDWEDIFARRFDANGEPAGDEFRVNTNTTSRQTYPAVDMNADGAFAIVWESLDLPGPDDRAICGQLFNALGDPIGSQFTVQSDEGAVYRHPAVAMRTDGRFTVVWVKDTTTNSVWRRNFQADGTSPYLSTRVNELFNFTSLTRPQIAFDDAGNHVIAWDAHPSSFVGDDIHIRRYHWSGAPILEESRVNTYQTGAQSNLSVAMTPDGQFLVVWQSDTESDITKKDIFGQRFPSQPNNLDPPIFLGDEFQINTYVVEDQRYPAVAIDANGRFVCSWESFGQDGSQYGVFADFGPKTASADIDDSGLTDFSDYGLLAREWGDDQNPLRADLIDDNLIDYKDLGALCEKWLTPSHQCCEVDLNGGGTVDFKDYAIWAADFSGLGPGLAGDVTTDGIVDMKDLKPLAYHWTTQCE